MTLTLLVTGFIVFVGFVYMIARWRTKSVVEGLKLDRLKRGLDIAKERDKKWVELDKKRENPTTRSDALRWWDRRMRK
jgi:hypothetical protein